MPADEIICSPIPHYVIADTVALKKTVMSNNPISSRTLLQIEEELDSEEQEVISYACQGIVSNTNTRELLSHLTETTEHGLTEILYLVKRFDLLKKYLKITKADVEKLMASKPRIVSDYRNLMIDLNNQIEEDDLESFVFLLKSKLRNAGKLKKRTFLSLIIELEKNRSLTSENLDCLEETFQTIHRVDLKKLILRFKQKGNAISRGPYINAFSEAPAIRPTKQISSMKPHYEIYGHTGAKPIQETGSVTKTQISNERYLVRQGSMGFCLIIDCVGDDAEILQHTFKNLNFLVKHHLYKKLHEVENILQDVAAMEQHRYHDIFICIIISRGDSESLFCVDGNLPGLSLAKIRNFFTGQSCPNLIGKPKLFFIQNYVVSDAAECRSLVEVDGHSQDATNRECFLRCSEIPNEADIFWSQCKVDEMELHRSSGIPSLYLRSLIELLSDKQKRKYQDIQDIHTELNRIIYSKQTGYSLQLRHTLTKKLFLYAV